MEVIEVGPPGPMRCRAAWPGPTPIYPSRAGSPLRCGLSKCRNVGLAGANAHGLVDVEHKYLPVPDLPSLRGRSDGLDGVVDPRSSLVQNFNADMPSPRSEQLG